MKITINLPPGLRAKLHGSSCLRPACKFVGITELTLVSRGYRTIRVPII